MINFKANLAFVHLIMFVVVLAINEGITKHAGGGSGQKRLQTLLAQAALLGNTRAAKLFHILAIFAFAAVVAGARLTSMTADSTSPLHIRTRHILRPKPLLDAAFGAWQVAHDMFSHLGTLRVGRQLISVSCHCIDLLMLLLGE